MSKVQTRAGAAAAARLAYFLRRLSLDLVGIAGARKGDGTPAGKTFCEILRQLTGTRSRITSVKSKDCPRLPTLSPAIGLRPPNSLLAYLRS
jgi:hypothetical protein